MKRLVIISFATVAMGFGFGQIGDGPVVKKHVSQSDIEAGNMGLPEIFSAGHDLFNAKFNMFDGQGRPGTTGGGAARTLICTFVHPYFRTGFQLVRRLP